MSTMMRFKDEKEYQDLMARRAGWPRGAVMEIPREAKSTLLAREPLVTGCLPCADMPGPRQDRPENTPKAAARTATSFEGLKRASSRAQSSRTAPGVLRRSRAAVLPKSLEVARKQSGIEVILAQQIHLLQLPTPKRNYLFMPGRRLELDFAWPERMIALEVQGMVHRIAGRFKADMEKRALALLAGWRILEVGGKEIRSGQASRWLEQLLKGGAT